MSCTFSWPLLIRFFFAFERKSKHGFGRANTYVLIRYDMLNTAGVGKCEKFESGVPTVKNVKIKLCYVTRVGMRLETHAVGPTP